MQATALIRPCFVSVLFSLSAAVLAAASQSKIHASGQMRSLDVGLGCDYLDIGWIDDPTAWSNSSARPDLIEAVERMNFLDGGQSLAVSV